jgi:hypothetical protein
MKKIVFLLLMSLVCIGLLTASAKTDVITTGNTNTRQHSGPYNLMATIIDINDVLLVWQNPDFINPPMGFRIYCNSCMVEYISGVNVTDCFLQDVCAGCHQFYVTAFFDSGCESIPSNIAELTVTSNNDCYTPVKALSVDIYPCPLRHECNVSVQGGGKSWLTDLTIFNIKGQIVRRMSLRSGETIHWDTSDSSGRQVPAGVYFLKAVNPEGSVTKKLTILK